MNPVKLLVVLILAVLSGCTSLSSRFEAEGDEVGRLQAQLEVVNRELAAAKAERAKLLADAAAPASGSAALAVTSPSLALKAADLEVERLSGRQSEVEAQLLLAKDRSAHTLMLIDEQQARDLRNYRNNRSDLWKRGL